MKRDETALAELARPDGEEPSGQVHIVSREPACLGQPQSGRDEQREQRDVGPRPKPATRQQVVRLAQKGRDLGLAVC